METGSRGVQCSNGERNTKRKARRVVDWTGAGLRSLREVTRGRLDDTQFCAAQKRGGSHELRNLRVSRTHRSHDNQRVGAERDSQGPVGQSEEGRDQAEASGGRAAGDQAEPGND